MSDLVKRLRGMANNPDVDFDAPTLNEAADHIDALSAELAISDGLLEDAKTRIEALEAALRDALNDIEVDDKGMCRWSDVANAQVRIRAALDPASQRLV